MNPKVDEFLEKNQTWNKELSKLRSILLECNLSEDFKWKTPCYTLEGKNIVLLGRFKEWCVISFLKGVLLKDKENILELAGEHSQSSKVIRFTSVQEIEKIESILKNYILEAIQVEKAGLKVELKKNEDIHFVAELQNKIDEDLAFGNAFKKLTLGRQRGYNLYFSSAKQAKTRMSRIKKYENRILNGKGINDCTCGLSKKMPTCDGSHKFA
ncbi:DUF1801 domain-containing protein [Bernardetia sp.]|uniref:DUF1801 domain-containing protein n=1 Tax=Bernardetia sp. TaxID=1937974 RepID=UPI0025BC4E49|nr:DUF1801 domain-containing protein [Bernardetia sp.]